MWDACRWLNEPARWSLDHGTLRATTDDRTDFWRETAYGYTFDTGHAFGFTREGDFQASLRVRADYAHRYDQAGMMLRIDESHWVKFGAEFIDGRPVLSSVLTLGRSDWAIGTFDGPLDDFHLRAKRRNGALHLEASRDGAVWMLFRLGPFPGEPCFVGAMCCTPERGGLEAVFDRLIVAPCT